MLNRMRRFGSTGSEGEKLTDSPRLTQPAQEFSQRCREVRRRAQPPTGKQLGFRNHSQPPVVLQAAAGPAAGLLGPFEAV
jgi:hypothetical protein